jgi:hypothetical protein
MTSIEGCKKRGEKEVEMETAGGTKKRSPVKNDEQPLPPRLTWKRRCTLLNPLR